MFPLINVTATQGRQTAYTGVCLLLFSMGIIVGVRVGLQKGIGFNLVHSDGRGYYAYLPSVLLDGDLDFTNQIEEHWDVSFSSELLEDRTETGLVQNKYPIGLALTLLPAFLVGHAIAWASGGWIVPDGYSWPYQVCCLAMIELLVWLTLRRIDEILTRRLGVPPLPTFLACLVLVFGTPYVYYTSVEPFMVHAVSAFWCTEVVALAINPAIRPKILWPTLAFAMAMALVCRPTNAYLAPLLIFCLVQRVRADGWHATLTALPLACTALVPIGLQMLTWRILQGHWVAYSYHGEGFLWLHPALWQTLFSSRHGLFFWSPILLFAVVGLLRRIREPFLCCWIASALLLWYANSAWHCWWFGAAFGARAFLELVGLFGVGLGLLLDAILPSSRWVAAFGSLSGLLIGLNGVMMGLYLMEIIPRIDYPF
jgi:hypothetical protein